MKLVIVPRKVLYDHLKMVYEHLGFSEKDLVHDIEEIQEEGMKNMEVVFQ